MRLLFERSTLTYAEIAQKTGVSQATISRYAHAGGWRRPRGAPKATAFANGLPSSQLKRRALARRLRDICQRYLDEMEQDPDPRDFYDCRSVLAMLEMAKEAERRKPRRPLAVRARAIAERYLDQMEKDPEIEPEMLAWVLKDARSGARGGGDGARGAPRRSPYRRRGRGLPSLCRHSSRAISSQSASSERGMSDTFAKPFTKAEMEAMRRASGEDARRHEETVRNGFWDKVKRFGRQIPFAEDVVAAYYCTMDPATPNRVRWILLGALAYFVLPVDGIADFLPLLGFTDDAAIIAAAIAQVAGSITEEHREKAREALRETAEATAPPS